MRRRQHSAVGFVGGVLLACGVVGLVAGNPRAVTWQVCVALIGVGVFLLVVDHMIGGRG